MARKVIKNKKKIQPKLKTKTVRPITQQKNPELRQKQKQIVNVKVNIDQSKINSEAKPSSNIPNNIINTYPLFQEQSRVPPITKNYNETNNYNQTNHYRQNDFRNPVEEAMTGINIHIPQHGNNRVNEPLDNHINIENVTHPTHHRENDFRNPEVEARTALLLEDTTNFPLVLSPPRHNTLRAGGGGSGSRYHEEHDIILPFGGDYMNNLSNGTISPLGENESFTFMGNNPMLTIRNRNRPIPPPTSSELNFIENQLAIINTNRGRGRPRTNVETMAYELDLAELTNHLNLNTREELDGNGIPQIYVENPYRRGRERDYVLVRGTVGKRILERRYKEIKEKKKSK